MRTAGIVLCGGQSKRMGQPKAWLPFGGELMLPRIVRLLGEVVHPIVVVAAPGQNLPQLPEYATILRDEEEGRGPLQGLAAGLTALQGVADAAYASSCDVPFLKTAFVRRMIDLLGDAPICVPRIGAFYHPLAAVYRVDVLDTVRDLLSKNLLRTSLLVESLPTRVIEAHELADVDPGLLSFRNVNTPADYEQAVRYMDALEE